MKSHLPSSNDQFLGDYVLVTRFSGITGYSQKAVYRKIESGVWLDGVHYVKAPDGRIHMCMPNYWKWIRGA